ncbi:MAG TPA: helix-turn-helix domain-containing protein, partial [Chloroflexota bacterium]
MQASSFGEQVRRHRIARGFSQEALAERAGLSVRGVSDLERSVRRQPQASTVGRLVDALGLTGLERDAMVGSAVRPASVPTTRGRGVEPPVPLTSFVGREADVVALGELLAADRLVTPVGPGGIGKTRLAIEVARGGSLEAVFADLSPLDNPELVPSALAAAFGLPDTGVDELVPRLGRELRDRSVLLVLDNCEHVIDACARVTEELLRACPRLRILATSREPVAAQGEVVWPLAVLGLPGVGAAPADVDQASAVRLFVDRARSAQPGFNVTPATARWVADICIQLEGLPLAVELAAARVRALGVRDLAERLDDRLGVLVSAERTAPGRHQTLRATLDWSHALLNGAERRLFARLAVFVGGFTAGAAERVCGTAPIAQGSVLDLLVRLVDRSLVVTEPRSDGSLRYRMLETVRQYAHERLEDSGELLDLRLKHATFYRDLAAEAKRAIWSADAARWLGDISAELGNVRAVVDWSLSGPDRVDLGLDTVAELVRFWSLTGRVSEGRLHLQRLLEAGGRARGGAWALYCMSFFAYFASDLELAGRCVREALDLAEARGDERTCLYARIGVGAFELMLGRPAPAGALVQRALTRAREHDGRAAIINATLILSEVEHRQGHDMTAERLTMEALECGRAHADDWSIAFSLFHLGRLMRLRGDFPRARSLQT